MPAADLPLGALDAHDESIRLASADLVAHLRDLLGARLLTNYTIAEAMPAPTVPTPPPGPLVESPSVIHVKGPGDAPVGTRPPQPAPSSAPLDPVDHGAGVGETLTSSGPTWPLDSSEESSHHFAREPGRS